MPVGLSNRFLLLYGSQTGQAKAIAEEIAEKADTFNLHADLHCLSVTDKKFFIERERCVVIITSTTGDGEAPDTASKFVRRLGKKTLPSDYLSHLNYALLGLGDSNYTNFCNCAKGVDKRLQELGAKPFYQSGWADDAVGLEVVAEPWIDQLFSAIQTFLGLPTSDTYNKIEVTPSILNMEQSQSTLEQTQDKCDTVGSNLHDSTDVSQTNNPGDIKTSMVVEQKESTKENSSISKETDSNSVNVNISNMAVTSDSKSNVDLNPVLNTKVELDTTLTSNVVTNTVSNCNTNYSNRNLNAESPIDIDALSDAFQTGIDLTGEATVESEEGSVKRSLPPLSESAITVPILPQSYLKIEFQPDAELDVESLPLQNGASFTSSSSAVIEAKVTASEILTSPEALKKTQLVQLDISGTELKYQPGDSFSLVCPNSEAEVIMLLKRLKLADKADMVYKLTILPGTKKRSASVPAHIHESGTLRNTLMTCVDIREPPKKALLRALVEYTEDPSEKRRLQELCSKQGASEYTHYIREPNLSILDILHHFKSSQPPIERILEHSPRLQPRPFSVSSSPLTSPGSLSFVFNIVNIPHGSGRSYTRKGVATGWLEAIHLLKQMMGRMKITNEIKVPIYTRTNQSFHLLDDVTTPIILIGPGTGVAPFIGFLDHVAAQRQAGNRENGGDIWLFFGCRNRSKDFLFKEKLESHLANSTLSRLHVSFSRDTDQPEGSPLYVQDNIRSHGVELVKLLEEKGAVVYVCGDAKNMAKDVNEAFIDIVSKEKGITAEEGRKYMMKLRLDRRYKEDVWT